MCMNGASCSLCRQPLLQQQQQQQLMLSAPQDNYLASRNQALHEVESAIRDIGGIFQQLAHMVGSAHCNHSKHLCFGVLVLYTWAQLHGQLHLMRSCAVELAHVMHQLLLLCWSFVSGNTCQYCTWPDSTPDPLMLFVTGGRARRAGDTNR